MHFLNPKTDFAFKKIFGSNESKDILISFLNSILDFKDKNTIIDITIIDPYLAPKIKGMKDTYLDVRATTEGDKHFIIEMQVLNVEGFEKRILYNAAKAYSIQINKAEDYIDLNPVIAITITDFIMFDDIKKVITAFRLLEKNELIEYKNNGIELVFVELPKFNKKEDELRNIIDKWIYFLKNAGDLTFVPKSLEVVPGIKKAFEIANKAGLSEEELEDQERREMFIQDQRGMKIKALKEGLKEGMEKGRQERDIEIAKIMIKKGFEINSIIEITGLHKEELEKL